MLKWWQEEEENLPFFHSRAPDSIAVRTNYHGKEIYILLFHKTCALHSFAILRNEVKLFSIDTNLTHNLQFKLVRPTASIFSFEPKEIFSGSVNIKLFSFN